MRKKILIIVILVLVLSFFVIPGSFAIYRAIASPGGEIATATWNVALNQTGVTNHISVSADDTSTATYTLNVTSTSEVDIVYAVVISGLATGVSVKLDEGSFIAASGGEVIFNNAGTILYSDQTKTKVHTLTFKAATGTTPSTDSQISVNVIARQKLHNE